MKALKLDADEIIKEELTADPLDHYMRYLSNTEDFYKIMDSNPRKAFLNELIEKIRDRSCSIDEIKKILCIQIFK